MKNIAIATAGWKCFEEIKAPPDKNERMHTAKAE
jgi:hypothetical protein